MGIFKSTWERQVDDSLFSFIELEQFRNFKFSTVWNYFLMWFLLLLHTALYCVDIYTCVKLLAFNTWSSEIDPYISFKISKWLFSACIICSFVLLGFEAIRGIRIFRTGNISLTYTNPFAKRLRSIISYNCYCALNEINPTGGFEKMAFYTYFTLHDSKKLILADSPRQVINALTLWSVLKVDTDFWETLKSISISNRNEALVLYGMLISFFIWIFFITQLFFALVFAIPVYHSIIKNYEFNSLKQFVCLKVDKTVKRLARIHQKESLKRFKNNSFTKSNDSLIEKPSLPNLNSTNSFQTFKLSNQSSFDSISNLPPLRPYSQLTSNNSSRNLLSTISQKENIDVNPFRDQIKKPSQIYSIKRNDSTESFPDRSISLNTSFNKNLNNSTIELNNSTTSFNEKFYPIEKIDTIENINNSNSDLESELYPEDDEIASFNDSIDNEINGNRNVRTSLILRARDMEMEDYSKFTHSIV